MFLSKFFKGKAKKNEPEKVELVISQYSDMPRLYTINGVKYDIDCPDDIRKIPLFKDLITVNGEKYGMDTILLEHAIQARPKNDEVFSAAMDKVNEYRYCGIVFKSKREIEQEERWRIENEKKKAAEAERKRQCNQFTIDDMQQFTGIPFGWSWVASLFHTNGVAWFILNMNNQEIARQYVVQLDNMIHDLATCLDGVGNCSIDIDAIDFDYPTPLSQYSMANTRVECYPYTPTGKLSKYPAVLIFRSKTDDGNSLVSGEIKILKDGNIGNAKVYFINNDATICFSFGLWGKTFLIKKVTKQGASNDPNCYEELFRFE